MGLYLIKFWGDDTNLIKEEKLEILETKIISYSQKVISQNSNIKRATYEIYSQTKSETNWYC